MEVFAIYWIDNETFFLVFSNGYDGLLSFRQTDIEIVDSSVIGNFIYYNNGVYYQPLIKERLLDDLLGADSLAYSKFLKILHDDLNYHYLSK